ncbi:WASP homolog-associated protein with actin, membranes and microtubules isoform 2-T2 [Rhinophrynus dorsalis]
MECERMDSLEGWVAVRPNVFEEPEKYKLGFIVAWNQVESMFAVTCHNRTLQRKKRREEDGESREQSSWAGLYSVQDLEHIHRQLSSVCSRLEHCFPSLPSPSPAGSLWTLLFPGAPSWEGAPGELDSVCRALEVYLGAAVEQCGRRIVLDVLFPEDQEDSEQYFENLHEFRKKSLEEQVSRAKENLRRILHEHKNADKMMSLLELYEEEDDAFMELVTMATQFYQYLLQPFRDMRELAILYKLEILKSLEMDDLGPKRIEALQKEADKWNTRAEEAVFSIQNVTVNYFKETAKALAAMQKQMEQDGRRFGQAAWASALPRLERIKSMLAKETLQHMRSKELCLNQKRAEIKRNMGNLSDTERAMVLLDELELQYYETQLELYDVQFEILQYEEMLLITELNAVRRQMKEKQEEVVYYDTCEDPQELQVYDQSQHNLCPVSVTLKKKAQQLETKRGNICARRALLRNKKDQCIETQDMKLKQFQEMQKRLHQHHSVQMKREKKKEEEKKKKEFVDKEREKTLQRLKTFKGKSESQFVLKTSRIQSRLPSKQQGRNQNIRSSGSMEEVLASLKRSENLLRRVEQPEQSIADVRDNILTAIRQGVKLRKVHRENTNKEPENELEKSIKAAMQRMKKVSTDSEDEEKGDYISGEWDT